MQGKLNFDEPACSSTDGLSLWRRQREAELLALARKWGLPIGQNVEVWLRGAIRLRGRLQFDEETLLLPLENHQARFAVDGVPFLLSEMESCTRF